MNSFFVALKSEGSENVLRIHFASSNVASVLIILAQDCVIGKTVKPETGFPRHRCLLLRPREHQTAKPAITPGASHDKVFQI
jgi:hypothetical protein